MVEESRLPNSEPCHPGNHDCFRECGLKKGTVERGSVVDALWGELTAVPLAISSDINRLKRRVKTVRLLVSLLSQHFYRFMILTSCRMTISILCPTLSETQKRTQTAAFIRPFQPVRVPNRNVLPLLTAQVNDLTPPQLSVVRASAAEPNQITVQGGPGGELVGFSSEFRTQDTSNG